MRLSEALENTDTLTIAPKSGMRLSEVMSEEKPEFELKALSQETISHSRGMTPEELSTYRKKKEIDLVKEYPRDFTGSTSQIEAFMSGVLPLGYREFERPGVNEAHPIAKAVGDVTGLISTGVLTSGIAPIVTYSKQLASLPTVARFVAGRMAQSGATFGLKELADNMAELLSGDKKDFNTVTTDVLTATGFGAGLGSVGSIASPVARIPAEAAYGFVTAKMGGSDNFEAGISAGMFAVFGLFNTKNLSEAYKKTAFSGAKRAMVDKMVAKGYNAERAEIVSDRYFKWAIERNGGWGKQTIKDFDTFSKAMRKGWKIIVEPELKPTDMMPLPEPKPPVSVAPELQPLYKEAKKYKTPQEFVKSQDVSSAIEHINKIAKDFDIKYDLEIVREDKFVDISNPQVQESLLAAGYTKEEINEWIKKGEKAKITGEHTLHGDIQRSKIFLYNGYTAQDIYHEFSHAAEEQGKSGISIGKTLDEKARNLEQLLMASGEKRYTPQQLTDIWNKAQGEGEPPKPPLKGKVTQGEGVVDEGEFKTRGLAKGVEEKAIENKLTQSFGSLPEYQTVNMKDQASKAQELITNDYETARRVAMGEELSPEGILPESVFVAVENKAVKEGDVETLRDLATSSGLTAEVTTMGQRIRALAERDPESPVTAINEISKVRDQRAQKTLKSKNTKKLHKETVNQIKGEIKKSTSNKETWIDFIRSLQC